MPLQEMNIPDIIKREAANIIQRIEDSTGILDATMAGGVAEGFVIAIVCLHVVTPKDVDQLETLFSQATDRKMAALRGLT